MMAGAGTGMNQRSGARPPGGALFVLALSLLIAPGLSWRKGSSGSTATIVDSNLTTLIAAVLLFQFGSGPIKGFAVTLAIGLVTSMFTAIMLTRLLLVTWLRRRRPKQLAF